MFGYNALVVLCAVLGLSLVQPSWAAAEAIRLFQDDWVLLYPIKTFLMLCGVITLVFVIEKVLHALRGIRNRHAAHIVGLALNELNTLGILSLGLFVVNAFASLTTEWVLLFEWAHILLFLMSINMLVFMGIFISTTSLNWRTWRSSEQSISDYTHIAAALDRMTPAGVARVYLLRWMLLTLSRMHERKVKSLPAATYKHCAPISEPPLSGAERRVFEASEHLSLLELKAEAKGRVCSRRASISSSHILGERQAELRERKDAPESVKLLRKLVRGADREFFFTYVKYRRDIAALNPMWRAISLCRYLEKTQRSVFTQLFEISLVSWVGILVVEMLNSVRAGALSWYDHGNITGQPTVPKAIHLLTLGLVVGWFPVVPYTIMSFWILSNYQKNSKIGVESIGASVDVHRPSHLVGELVRIASQEPRIRAFKRLLRLETPDEMDQSEREAASGQDQSRLFILGSTKLTMTVLQIEVLLSIYYLALLIVTLSSQFTEEQGDNRYLYLVVLPVCVAPLLVFVTTIPRTVQFITVMSSTGNLLREDVLEQIFAKDSCPDGDQDSSHNHGHGGHSGGHGGSRHGGPSSPQHYASHIGLSIGFTAGGVSGAPFRTFDGKFPDSLPGEISGGLSTGWKFPHAEPSTRHRRTLSLTSRQHIDDARAHAPDWPADGLQRQRDFEPNVKGTDVSREGAVAVPMEGSRRRSPSSRCAPSASTPRRPDVGEPPVAAPTFPVGSAPEAVTSEPDAVVAGQDDIGSPSGREAHSTSLLDAPPSTSHPIMTASVRDTHSSSWDPAALPLKSALSPPGSRQVSPRRPSGNTDTLSKVPPPRRPQPPPLVASSLLPSPPRWRGPPQGVLPAQPRDDSPPSPVDDAIQQADVGKQQHENDVRSSASSSVSRALSAAHPPQLLQAPSEPPLSPFERLVKGASRHRRRPPWAAFFPQGAELPLHDEAGRLLDPRSLVLDGISTSGLVGGKATSSLRSVPAPADASPVRFVRGVPSGRFGPEGAVFPRLPHHDVMPPLTSGVRVPVTAERHASRGTVSNHRGMGVTIFHDDDEEQGDTRSSVWHSPVGIGGPMALRSDAHPTPPTDASIFEAEDAAPAGRQAAASGFQKAVSHVAVALASLSAARTSRSGGT
eukprot:TRINITY_DN5138_c0_g1_i1.p1 TRINITY_DN5138_c0_g1~~TRINITY_DN5138_c0_g1_i1.p1  ORF type:complete len:1130 (+),score=96.41 TRINITY_DN5138_c0_g1_i1:267-3656(+)